MRKTQEVKKMQTAKQLLIELSKITTMIECKRLEIDYWNSLKTGLSGSGTGPKVSQTANPQRMETAVIASFDISKEIEDALKELHEKQRRVLQIIEQLPESQYKVLHLRYVIGVPLDEIGDSFKVPKTYSWVTTTHGRALENVQKIIDGMQPGDICPLCGGKIKSVTSCD